MYHSALVALKPGQSNAVLISYAVRLARERGLHLHGIAVLDRERVAPPEAVPIGGSAFKVMRDEAVIAQSRQEVQDILAEFAAQCREAGVRYATIPHENGLVGDIAQAAHRHDLLLLGHTAGTGIARQSGGASPLHEILKESPRPAMVVPAMARQPGPVLVAYDGSRQAARAVAAFLASGLFVDHAVEVLSIHADENRAQSWAQASGHECVRPSCSSWEHTANRSCASSSSAR